MSQLPGDCINEIFEHLEYEQVTLRSCLLVNRLWCEFVVRILWRNVLYYCSLNFRTLMACLPNESKKILQKNGITILTPTSKPPMFNYASFCKVFSFNYVNSKIDKFLEKNKQSIFLSPIFYNNDYIDIVKQEVCKLFMNQISSLKELNYWNHPHETFTIYPGLKDSLKNLSELNCSSNVHSEFFYQLSQICHNIQILYIQFEQVISKGLTDLISAQKSLKRLELDILYTNNNFIDIVPSLTKISSSVNKFNLGHFQRQYIPLSFIANFTNLQEIMLSLDFTESFEDFKKLQYVT